MATENNIRDELLRQDGGGEREVNDLMRELDGLRNTILARDRARLVSMANLTKLTWVLVVVFGAGLFLGRPTYALYPELIQQLYILFKALVVIAVLLTIFLYVRSRTLTTHEIETRLTRIEEQLRTMVKKD
jgi:hypothetical protein